jgi:hypothetical protein
MFNSPIVGMDDVDITYLIIRYDLEEEPIAATPEEIHVTCGDIQLPPIRSINVQHPERADVAILDSGKERACHRLKILNLPPFRGHEGWTRRRQPFSIAYRDASSLPYTKSSFHQARIGASGRTQETACSSRLHP